MNKLSKLIIGLMLINGIAAFGQTSTNVDNTKIKAAFLSFLQNVETNRTVTLAVYPTYAPGIVVNGKSDSFGVGIAALCPVSAISSFSNNTLAQHAFGGLRLDYLAGQAFASTVALGMKGDFQIYSHNVEVFAESGVNIPFSGFGQNNVNVGAMVGSGAYTSLFSFGKVQPDGTKAGSVGLFVAIEKWTQFNGEIYHGGPVLNWSF
jgi:hypothetical protein